ncbi:hypothetical protein [Acidovorax bellezanensis]|nr:hypothetical protein [Acidovorax sp. Be4]
MVLELNDVSVARQMVQGLVDGKVVDWIHLEQCTKADMLPAHGAAEASAHEAINVALTRSRGNASKPASRGPEDSAQP